MIVDRIQYQAVAGGLLRLSAEGRVETAQNVILDPWFEISCEAGEIATSGDPFVAGLLVPCMHQGENLHVRGRVSGQLLAGVREIQEILCAWYPNLNKIAVTADDVIANAPNSESKRVGCFFSGGVDAWYTLTKHENEVGQLILVRGFDIATDGKEAIWNQTVDNVREIAEKLSKNFVCVHTNIRRIGDMRRGRASWGKPFDGDFWGQYLHGSSIAAVAMCLQNATTGLRKVYVGATYSYDHLAPWGSHPLLDRLWSTADIALVHDGAEANRMQKIQRISQSQHALSSLRVCYENREGQYNCCNCEKCFRTMMALRACGSLEKATAFHRPLDLREARKRLYDDHVHPWYRVIIPEAERIGDTELANTLKVIVGDKFSFEQLLAKSKDHLSELLPSRLFSALHALASRKRWRSRLANVTPPVRTSA